MGITPLPAGIPVSNPSSSTSYMRAVGLDGLNILSDFPVSLLKPG